MPKDAGNEPDGDPGVQGHETIIQQLNRTIGEDFFPVDSFENASEWDDVPIIFAQDHPDLEAYDKDPVAELARIAKETGRRAEIVGTPANTRIEMKGRPRLMSDLTWGADPDVQKLYDEGKLAVSTGFWANSKQNRLDGYVKPHHILLFEEDETNQPRDKGVVVLNKENGMKAFTNEGRVLSGKNQTRLNEIFASLKSFIEEITGGTSEPEPEQNTETVQEKEPEQKKNMSEEIIASKDAEIAELKALLQKEQDNTKILSDKIAEIESASKEAAWQALKNKLPPGMVHKAEDEKATRELFESDPVAFTNKLLDVKAETKGQSGQQFVNKAEDNPDDPIALGRELRMSTGRMR